MMNVTERPIVVALGDEVIDRAGCIVRVTAHPAHAGMKNADVREAPATGWGRWRRGCR